MNHISILILSIAFISLSYNSTTAQEEKRQFKTEIGNGTPDFTFEATDGKTYSLKDFKGKTVWLNFFATWCGPCLIEIPELIKLSEKYEDVVFIGIGRGHTVEELKAFAKLKNITYIVAADPDKKIFNLFADKYIPRNYLIKKCKVKQQEVGYKKEEFEKLIEHLKELEK
ncbi:MAG: thiol-disulfide isomerase/thioredoxin [Maribacter sp.]|jgi:thiol-disulfide isomerase/thioredoxin